MTFKSDAVEANERLQKLIKVCQRVQDTFDAALTCPNDAVYRADAWDALDELERVTNEVGYNESTK